MSAGPGAASSEDAEQESHRLTALEGLAALSLDALSSVAYGPEAIVIVAMAAGTAGLNYTLPATGAIVLLLAVLVISYRQVIEAFPGGGAYAVARTHLGVMPSLVAAGSLVVDYVLNAAVGVSAGVEALGILLGTMLIGLSILIRKFQVTPISTQTVLAELTAASLGHNVVFFLRADRPGAPVTPRRWCLASLVVVPVNGLSRLTEEGISAALSLRRWQGWHPDVPLITLVSRHRALDPPIVAYLRDLEHDDRYRRLVVLDRAIRQGTTDVVVCRLRFRLAALADQMHAEETS